MKLFSNIQAFTDTVGPRNAIDDTMVLTLIIQRIFGQNILDPKWALRRFLLHQLVGLSLIVYVAFGTTEILKNTNDIKMIAEASYTYGVSGLCVVKYILFIKEKILFRELYVKAKTSILETITDVSHHKMVEILNKFKRVLNVMLSMVTLPVLSYVLRCCWYYAKGERVTLSKTTATLMPMTTPYYEIATGLHAIFMTEIAFTFFAIDMWFIFLLNLYCAASDCVVKLLKVEKEDGESEEVYALRLNECLRIFYFRHIKLVDYLETFNKTFRWQTLIPLISVIILACIPMLSMSKELDFTFATNIMPTILEIFVYNWFGEQIKTKSSNLRDALVNFDWTILRLKERRAYYVILCYTNKDFGITTAVGSELSLITLTSVLKASYQAFTMLQSFDN